MSNLPIMKTYLHRFGIVTAVAAGLIAMSFTYQGSADPTSSSTPTIGPSPAPAGISFTNNTTCKVTVFVEWMQGDCGEGNNCCSEGPKCIAVSNGAMVTLPAA